MRVVHVPDATKAENSKIVTRHMLPRVAESCGLTCTGVAPDALELLTSGEHCSGCGIKYGIEKVLEGALRQTRPSDGRTWRKPRRPASDEAGPRGHDDHVRLNQPSRRFQGGP